MKSGIIIWTIEPFSSLIYKMLHGLWSLFYFNKQGVINLRVRAFILSFCVVTCISTQVTARKYASIVVDADTGKIHHQANPDVLTYPASLTKMMTLYLTFKALRLGKLNLHQKLKVSKHASRQSPSKLWLEPGSTITVQHAIYALVTKSANDVAVVLAEALGGGSESRFAQQMTVEAKRLGMSKTVFKNASGLPNSRQVTTARDMATLSLALYEDYPEYFSYFKKQSFTYKGTQHRNHNKLLGKLDGVDGIKTGYINASGFNLAASIVRDNRRIMAVVMGGRTSQSRDKHMMDLLERTYKKVKQLGANTFMSMNHLIHNLGSNHKAKVHTHRPVRPPIPPSKAQTLLANSPADLVPFGSPPVSKVHSLRKPSEPKVESMEDLIVTVDVDLDQTFPRADHGLRPVNESLLDI